MEIVKRMMAHPFFAKKPPKSLDRNAFSRDPVKHMSVEDGAATLAAFTIEGILHSAAYLPAMPKQWIVTGGGRRNAFIMDELRRRSGAEVITIEDAGFNGNATEAEGWAYLAVRSYLGLPLSFPLTTGVKQPTTGGVLHKASDAAA
jgi:anhydro-N-acetylmuramic acid kinase